MTLEYARILDETVERSFSEAVERMQEGALSWVPSFFEQKDYALFAEGDAVSWIRPPHLATVGAIPSCIVRAMSSACSVIALP